MSYTAAQLLVLTTSFEKLAQSGGAENPEWVAAKNPDEHDRKILETLEAMRNVGNQVIDKMSQKPEEKSELDQIMKSFDAFLTKLQSKASLVAEAAKKKKLDPKAKVRNRGTVCVPAESAKDKKDHFPINDEGQARSALSRVEGLTSAPWYNGSLEGLRALVKRKVHSKYPSIGKSEKTSKKSSFEDFESLLATYAQMAEQDK